VSVVSYLRGLDPRLPRAVWALELGGVINSFGNGFVYPFLFIYLHNVRGFALGVSGLIVATNAGVALLAGTPGGAAADRFGAKRTLAASLALLTVAYALFPLVREPWHALALAGLVGLANGVFWPSYHTLLAAITPQTRAILIANPNNPTGTAIDLPSVERILKAAPNAAVLIDEAYYEFFGVTALPLLAKYPHLFVSRTFSKVYGMAALRMGCLFSQAGNVKYLHKAQSPYSVNTLAAAAAEAAVRDTAYIENYVTEALAAREMLEAGFEKLDIAYVPGSANFVLGYFGDRAVEIRDALREKAILVRDRSYEIPGGVRITVGTRAQARLVLAELEKIW